MRSASQAVEPPTITAIADQTVFVGQATGALSFTVGDTETTPANLIVTGTSSNTTLIPNGNVVIAGSGANRTVTVTPAAGQHGVATITVLVSDGDLNLGGIDFNRMLEDVVAAEFKKEFRADPTDDAVSRQFLALEVEQAKRSLSVRPKAAVTCQHAGKRKTYQIPIDQFEKLTKPLLDRSVEITLRMLKNNKLGWAHVDAVLTVGGDGGSAAPVLATACASVKWVLIVVAVAYLVWGLAARLRRS